MDAENSQEAMELLKKDQQFNFKKCWLLKTCFACVCTATAVFAFLFVAQKLNKLENRLEVEIETDRRQIGSSSEHRHEALKSQVFYLLNNETMDQSKTFVSDGNNIDLLKNISDSLKSLAREGQMHGNKQEKGDMDQASKRHFFNIGMREDIMMQDCRNPHLKHSFPDIDYAFLGYDIYKGFPLAHGHDPGFTYPIFKADYSHGQQTADCRYSVPMGLIVIPDVSCVTSFTSNIIKSSKELNRDLSVTANAGGTGFGAAFSVSAGYKHVSSDLSSNGYIYIISSAQCNYYYSKIQKENPPPFSDVFLDWIQKFNSSRSNSTYLDFFNTFGTHFATEITFGARFLYEHKMKESIYKKKREHDVNLEAQASYNGIIRASGGFGLSVKQREEASEFSKSVETKTITVGAAPPANGDALTWASTVQNNPVPSKYKLEPIESLFREEYMADIDVDYETISVNMQTFKEEYYRTLMSEELQNQIEFLSGGRVTKTLSVDNGGPYGSWFTPQFCPVDTFAIGYNKKYERNQGPSHDNTALNAVSLQCAGRNGTRISHRLVQSAAGHRGHWTGDVFCPEAGGIPLFLQRFALKVEPERQGGDNTMANVVRFSCRDLHWTKHPQDLDRPDAGSRGQYGRWSELCPKGSAICGLQARIEGHLPKGDNTALNDLRFFCCN